MFNKGCLLFYVLCLTFVFGLVDLSRANNELGNNAAPDLNTGTAVFSPRIGEVLEYRVWVKSVILGGRQTFKITAADVVQDHTVLKVQYELKTTGIAWNLTKYFEKENLIIDRNGLYPLMIRREIHQGEVVTVEETNFDYAKGTLSRSVFVDGVNKETKELKLPGIVQDGVSLQLFLRKGDFHKGYNKLYFYGNGIIEEAEYMVSELSEPVSLESGTYSDYYRIEYGKGNILVFIAKDTYRTPFNIRVTALFGKCDARLFKIQ
jgi:hypothetical protein